MLCGEFIDALLCGPFVELLFALFTAPPSSEFTLLPNCFWCVACRMACMCVGEVGRLGCDFTGDGEPKESERGGENILFYYTCFLSIAMIWCTNPGRRAATAPCCSARNVAAIDWSRADSAPARGCPYCQDHCDRDCRGHHHLRRRKASSCFADCCPSD